MWHKGTARCPLEWEENSSKLSWSLLHRLPEQKLGIFVLLDHLPLIIPWNSPGLEAPSIPRLSLHWTGPGDSTSPSSLCQRGQQLPVFSSSNGIVRLKSIPSPPVPASPLPGKLRNSRCRGQPLLGQRSPSSHGDDSPRSDCYAFICLEGAADSMLLRKTFLIFSVPVGKT